MVILGRFRVIRVQNVAKARKNYQKYAIEAIDTEIDREVVLCKNTLLKFDRDVSDRSGNTTT
jgi:hypothetical protein